MNTIPDAREAVIRTREPGVISENTVTREAREEHTLNPEGFA